MKIIFISSLCCFLEFAAFGQVHFRSSLEDFELVLPVEPLESKDTIHTEFGYLPRYLMMAKTVEHGRNLMFLVEVIELPEQLESLSLLQFKNAFVKRKRTGSMKFYLFKEESNEETSDPYEIELYFADQHGGLNFVKLFKINSKVYSIESYELKSPFRAKTKPNKLTREFFDSFSIKTDVDKGKG